MELITRNHACMQRHCLACRAWRLWLGSLPGPLILIDAGTSPGGAGGPTQPGARRKKKTRGKEGLAWLGHIREGGLKEHPQAEDGRSSWHLYPQDPSQWTQGWSMAYPVAEAGVLGRAEKLDWDMVLLPLKALFYPTLSCLVCWAETAPASSRTVHATRLQAPSRLKVLP